MTILKLMQKSQSNVKFYFLSLVSLNPSSEEIHWKRFGFFYWKTATKCPDFVLSSEFYPRFEKFLCVIFSAKLFEAFIPLSEIEE